MAEHNELFKNVVILNESRVIGSSEESLNIDRIIFSLRRITIK